MVLAAPALATAAMQVRAQSTLDAAFNPNANDSLVSIVVQADRKTLAGGAFSTIASNGSGAVTRDGTACLQIDGRLDQTLDPCRWDIGWKANATSLGSSLLPGHLLPKVTSALLFKTSRMASGSRNSVGTNSMAWDVGAGRDQNRGGKS